MLRADGFPLFLLTASVYHRPPAVHIIHGRHRNGTGCCSSGGHTQQLSKVKNQFNYSESRAIPHDIAGVDIIFELLLILPLLSARLKVMTCTPCVPCLSCLAPLHTQGYIFLRADYSHVHPRTIRTKDFGEVPPSARRDNSSNQD